MVLASAICDDDDTIGVMYWNYRVCDAPVARAEGLLDGGRELVLIEMYYKSDPSDPVEEFFGWTEVHGLVSETQSGLRWVLEAMLGALNKPVLRYEDINTPVEDVDFSDTGDDNPQDR